MNRREALVAVGGFLGAGAAVTAVIPVGAQEDDGEGNENGADEGDGESDEGEDGGGGESEEGGEGGGNESGGNESAGGGGGGGMETVSVVDNAFEPAELAVEPGTTVEWAWQGTEAEHNVNPGEIPEEADWEGHQDLESGDFSFESTFEVEGDYEYVCDPHVGQGMTGTITVDPDAGEQAAEADVDIHDLGVPIQKHFVGLASFLATFVALVFTFYLLKYGESANTSSPGRDR